MKMDKLNNLKKIREIYGATQEEIAKAINVNRVTISKWESGSSRASNSNLERLSFFFGIGPEFFYEKELSDSARELILKTAQHAAEVEKESAGQRCKTNDFHEMFSKITFERAIDSFMFAMKMLLATAENGKLEDLKTAELIHKKMGVRLRNIIELREAEEKAKAEDDEETLFDLMDKFSENK